MSTIYLVRHGQAGTRDAYDSLSDLGRSQSRLLGEYLASQHVEFAMAYSGAMSRQLQTAEETRRGYVAAGGSFPQITVEEGWNEFDLGLLYDQLAPQLCVEDPEFRAEYARMREQVHAATAPNAEIHRKWQPCDSKLVEAWIRNQHAHSGETWEQFCGRISGRRAQLAECLTSLAVSRPRATAHSQGQTAGAARDGSSGNIIVFTSATPVAIWTSLALEIFDQRIMRLAGVLYNTAFTTMKLRGDQLLLFTFNAIPHLPTPDLHTHR